MTLMRVNIQKTLVGGLASNGTATFAHGLPTAPDSVQIRFVHANISVAPAWVGIRAVIDTANVTINNAGAGASDDMEVVAIAFHSLIQ